MYSAWFQALLAFLEGIDPSSYLVLPVIPYLFCIYIIILSNYSNTTMAVGGDKALKQLIDKINQNPLYKVVTTEEYDTLMKIKATDTIP